MTLEREIAIRQIHHDDKDGASYRWRLRTFCKAGASVSLFYCAGSCAQFAEQKHPMAASPRDKLLGEENAMGRILATIAALVFAGVVPSIVWAQADLREPAGKERLTIGGDWHNGKEFFIRY